MLGLVFLERIIWKHKVLIYFEKFVPAKCSTRFDESDKTKQQT